MLLLKEFVWFEQNIISIPIFVQIGFISTTERDLTLKYLPFRESARKQLKYNMHLEE